MGERRRQFSETHARVFRGLADSKRLRIIDALRVGERSVSELCDELGLPQANMSQHLAILRERRLVRYRRDGARVFYSISSSKVIEAIDLLHEMALE